MFLGDGTFESYFKFAKTMMQCEPGMSPQLQMPKDGQNKEW